MGRNDVTLLSRTSFIYEVEGETTEEAVQKLYLEKIGNHVENLGIYGVGSLQ